MGDDREPCRPFVPIIDIAPLFKEDMNAKLEVAAQIDEVCRGSGFFYISNHGVDMAKLFKTSTEFHLKIKEEEKKRIAIAAWNPENKKQVRNGYQPASEKKPVEMFCYLNPAFTPQHPHIQQGLPGCEVNVWPKEEDHPCFRQYCESYYDDCTRITDALLKGFSLALGKEESYFQQYFKKDDTLSSVVLIRYPYLENYPQVQVSKDGQKLGFGAHQDVDLIVVLAQTDVQNLQAETSDGTFRDVPPSDQHFLVNVGTYMDYLTHGAYRAVWHRVKHINTERLSIPFFVNLGYNDAPEPFFPRPEDREAYAGEQNAPYEYGQFLKKGLFDLIKSNGQR